MLTKIRLKQFAVLLASLVVLFGFTYNNYQIAQKERINEISSGSFVNKTEIDPKDLFLESWMLIKASYWEPQLNEQN